VGKTGGDHDGGKQKKFIFPCFSFQHLFLRFLLFENPPLTAFANRLPSTKTPPFVSRNPGDGTGHCNLRMGFGRGLV
jgi:hypothetical protein